MKFESKKLTVTAAEDFGRGRHYKYSVYEFKNGLILDGSSEYHNASFFQSRSAIEPCGNDVVIDIKPTEEEVTWSFDELQTAIAGSIAEFDIESIPEIAFDYVPLDSVTFGLGT